MSTFNLFCNKKWLLNMTNKLIQTLNFLFFEKIQSKSFLPKVLVWLLVSKIYKQCCFNPFLSGSDQIFAFAAIQIESDIAFQVEPRIQWDPPGLGYLASGHPWEEKPLYRDLCQIHIDLSEITLIFHIAAQFLGGGIIIYNTHTP